MYRNSYDRTHGKQFYLRKLQKKYLINYKAE